MLAIVRCRDLLSKNTKTKIHRTIILPVVLYGYETWSLALREEHKLTVFENRMLRSIFGSKWDEVAGGVEKTTYWRTHLHTSPNIIGVIKPRRMRWAGRVCGFCWRYLRERDHLEDPGTDGRILNIKINLQEMGWGGMDWNDQAQDRETWRALVNAVMNLWVA
jgi:hypothetical protein